MFLAWVAAREKIRNLLNSLKLGFKKKLEKIFWAQKKVLEKNSRK